MEDTLDREANNGDVQMGDGGDDYESGGGATSAGTAAGTEVDAEVEEAFAEEFIKDTPTPIVCNGHGEGALMDDDEDAAGAGEDDEGDVGKSEEESGEEEDDDEQLEMDEFDEDGEESVRSSQNESESPVVASPSSKTNMSTSDNESDISLSSEASPAKRRKPNENRTKGLKHYQLLRASKEPFPQDKSCQKLLRKKTTQAKNKKTIKKNTISMCVDCKVERVNLKKDAPRRVKDAPVCRFYLFRKLFYSNKSTIKIFGFPDSATDSNDADKRLWMPEDPPQNTSLELARFLLEEVGDQFCDLVKQENESVELLKEQDNENIIWRRVVDNLRELCDVCSTTLFNYHWTCGKCGFVVCISCFKARKQDDSVPERESSFSSKDDFGWPLCHKHIGEHDIEKLMLTQIIPGNSLNELFAMLHQIRHTLKIPQLCGCNAVVASDSNSISGAPFESSFVSNQKQNSESVVDNNLSSNVSGGISSSKDETQNSLSTNGTIKPDANPSDNETDDDDDDDVMGLMIESNGSNDGLESSGSAAETDLGSEQKDSGVGDVGPVPENIPSLDNTHMNNGRSAMVLKNFVRKGGSSTYVIKVHPKKIGTTSESKQSYPTVPHSWLNHGLLLRLEDPSNSLNLKMFQEQWKRGQPVLVSNVANNLTKELWTPESFSLDFGHKTNPLINCMSGKVLPNQKIKTFWDGFEHQDKRLMDDNGVPMLLKLKDWPPGEDFAKVCESRFLDLMKALPLGEYTHRDGNLNLAGRLPVLFSRPDLGPKMYIAYGSGLHLDKGTTNVHLDISDAVNVMVHVSEVKDADLTEHKKAVVKAIEESDCDNATINRVRKNEELPGALWHIWEAKDADKIRDLLNKVNIERGVKVEPHHDAIHDQSMYLDRELRRRLMEEYNVLGYPILQCAGDAVFVPAGAPHQVRNLNNCIKIAEDFVSPENVGHCFYLTEEFRNLTETHTNHEDKLQIKNIVYHTVKDAIAVIKASLKPEKATTQQ